MRRALPAADLPLLLHRSRREINLAADDALHARLLRGHVEVDRAIQIAVIRDRHCRHAQRLRTLHQVRYPRRDIEQRVLGVQVEVDEGVNP